jgi:CRISPR type III-A-associated RAMP protein Csm4
MNPGLVVKLRPTGPWRIGADSGARNRVDVIYHSDSLYSAVTSAMARLGSLEEWLDATARSAAPAVCLSSCFPFVDDVGLVVPPRSIWPPTSPALMSARVRWKSARFVPLGVVQALLAGQTLKDSHWTIDGPSECLLPAGKHGPFRTSLRFNAAVDRLTGASERHSIACIEFRPGAGLWSVAGFRDDDARARWIDPLKAAFRLLADSGFGGERSRGWGRAEMPEFVEGMLPNMILPPLEPEKAKEPAPPELSAEVRAAQPVVPLEVEAASEPSPVPPIEPPAEEPSPVPPIEEPPVEQPPAVEPPVEPPPPDPEPTLPVPEPQAPEPLIAAEGPLPPPETEPVAAEPEEPPQPTSEPALPEAAAAPESETPRPPALEPTPAASTEPDTSASRRLGGEIAAAQSHWMLSLFTPALSDAVDWTRGNYTLLARSGRVESPAGSGELKKQLQMIIEGSVIVAEAAPAGSAPDVAPEGFPHPVFRAGFALSIPLPEVS